MFATINVQGTSDLSVRGRTWTILGWGRGTFISSRTTLTVPCHTKTLSIHTNTQTHKHTNKMAEALRLQQVVFVISLAITQTVPCPTPLYRPLPCIIFLILYFFSHFCVLFQQDCVRSMIRDVLKCFMFLWDLYEVSCLYEVLHCSALVPVSVQPFFHFVPQKSYRQALLCVYWSGWFNLLNCLLF